MPETGYRASVRPWLAAVVKHIGLVIGGVVSGALGTVTLFTDADLPVIPPVGYFVICVALLSLASFRAFHDVYVEKVELAAKLDSASVLGMLNLKPRMRATVLSKTTLEVVVVVENRAETPLSVRIDMFDVTIFHGDGRKARPYQDDGMLPTTIAPGTEREISSRGVEVTLPGPFGAEVRFACLYAPTGSRTAVRIEQVDSLNVKVDRKGSVTDLGGTTIEWHGHRVVPIEKGWLWKSPA